jgi:riboflavin kinase/FMN adenylyltransferase
MRVYHGLVQFNRLKFAVVTSGTFDGVHIGHQKILARLEEVRKASGGESVVITFWPHPRLIIATDGSQLNLLTTIEEKIELLSQYRVDHLIIIPFTKEFSQLTSEEFVRQVLIDRIGTRKLVIGYDHRFGRNREGGFEYLVENAASYGFEVEEITRQDVEQVTVSSTRTRKALLEGNIHVATEYLGRYYSLHGTVIRGNQLGRTIGYPTANLRIEEAYKLVPADGVYAVKVDWNGNSFGGMLNIGMRPTVNGTYRTIEVHIFDFNEDIYDKELKIQFVGKIRTEQKFSGLETLKAQLRKDEKAARLMLR